MDKVLVGLKRLHPAQDGDIKLPAYATEGSAGLDVRTNVTTPQTLDPGARFAFPTGLAVEIPPGYEIQVRPRSGLAFRHGVTVANAPGTIDSDYRGELKVLLVNLGSESYAVERGERIAQLVVAPVTRISWTMTDELAESARGKGGFGSTGRS